MTRGRGRAGLRLASCLAVAASMIGNARAADAITLDITGENGARVVGRCTLGGAGGDEVLELDGPVPIRRELAGRSLACDLEATGTVVVDITRAGSRSRTSTSNGRVRVSVG